MGRLGKAQSDDYTRYTYYPYYPYYTYSPQPDASAALSMTTALTTPPQYPPHHNVGIIFNTRDIFLLPIALSDASAALSMTNPRLPRHRNTPTHHNAGIKNNTHDI